MSANHRLLEFGDAVTGETIDLSRMVHLGQTILRSRAEKEEEAIKAQRAADEQANKVLWAQHFALLVRLGLRWLELFAATPPHAPWYTESNEFTLSIWLRPLTIRIPGYAPIDFVLDELHHGDFVAHHYYVDSEGNVTSLGKDRYRDSAYPKAPTIESFCAALAQAAAEEDRLPEIADAAASSAKAWQQMQEKSSGLVEGPPPLDRIANALEAISMHLGMRSPL